jgi:hypothetical protein
MLISVFKYSRIQKGDLLEPRKKMNVTYGEKKWLEVSL